MRRAVLLTAIVAAALLADGAPAARRPTAAEKQAIVSAIQHSPLTRGVPAGEYRVAQIRIATAARGWAEALLVGRSPDAERVQTVAAILQRHRGRWRVSVVGGVGLGCRVPWSVRRDLRLIC